MVIRGMRQSHDQPPHAVDASACDLHIINVMMVFTKWIINASMSV
jgi:hypothetical protein